MAWERISREMPFYDGEDKGSVKKRRKEENLRRRKFLIILRGKQQLEL